ncbi:Helix-turn-helix [Clostridium cadaveris]|uniref:Helix-turn-helix n=1 Tax=Clostridium cadaveris TaxID=1529 RepID=A0A1I2KT37_9CLOT|nr:helix-turn-helix transcriptional regulator [Clostridium cadaveris]SFF68251.1 Helix-turn-helix [Clostridium cadaveris]
MINSIGENIRKIRIEKGLTQKELAKKSGVSLSALNKYEREDRIPKIDAIEKISEALNIQIDYLLGKTEFKKFDSQIMLDDIKHLIEKTDNSDEEFSKLVRNIVDTMFLTINSFVDSENIDALKIIHDLYRNMWTMKIIRNNRKTYDMLMFEELDENTTTIEKLKEKNTLLFSKLYEVIIKDNS